MVSLIYARSLELKSGVHDELAAITLMSTDLDRLTMSLQGVNEIWSNTAEMVIGMWLLKRQLGWVCFAPIVVVISKLLTYVNVGDVSIYTDTSTSLCWLLHPSWQTHGSETENVDTGRSASSGHDLVYAWLYEKCQDDGAF